MKTSVRNLFLGMMLTTILLACGSDDSNDPTPGGDGNLGTYVGNIQVTDDPQTDLGYILNAKVTVSHSGSTATVKITGDPGFDREYTGTYTSQVEGYHDINLTKQTKPVEKVAGDRVSIIDNELTVVINLANDEVTLRDSPTTDVTLKISGKLQMIGTDLLKE
ncbi:hypothetical protein KK062_08510 [Fulvivirgaceae bacterium PWU5]|uniref:Lipocalin-like domain-containing protein n=1 Tax=Dawidia cretensis TaxID=2782350 RepID=A0AAP2DVS0_9BACT|nr:hypothetical protein [Dawidia cretensis]MBT1708263.1 hypothetical protein [Dawidia cretensis]